MTDQQPDLDAIQARQRVADQILPIISATNVSRTACLTEPADSIPHLTARRIADNVREWVARGDWRGRPLTDAELDAAARADVTALVAEVRRLRTERNRYRTAWRLARTRALSTGGAADRYAVRAREGQTALQDMFVALLAAQMERDEAQAEAAALKAVLAKAHTAVAPAARSAAV